MSTPITDKWKHSLLSKHFNNGEDKIVLRERLAKILYQYTGDNGLNIGKKRIDTLTTPQMVEKLEYLETNNLLNLQYFTKV
jgi:hypothetical protein